jgi:predicted small secreted protein
MKNCFFISIIVIFLLFIVQSCNTMHGIGKDIEKSGEAIQKSVK